MGNLWPGLLSLLQASLFLQGLSPQIPVPQLEYRSQPQHQATWYGPSTSAQLCSLEHTSGLLETQFPYLENEEEKLQGPQDSCAGCDLVLGLGWDLVTL